MSVENDEEHSRNPLITLNAEDELLKKGTTNKRLLNKHRVSVTLPGNSGEIQPQCLTHSHSEGPRCDRDQNYLNYCVEDEESCNDLTAMSVLSLYERDSMENDDMDTRRDMIESTPITPMTSNAFQLASQEDLPEMLDKSAPKVCSNCIDCPKHSIFFNDGLRSVDFVLVWDAFAKEALTEEARKKRRIFEGNLRKEGLQLEYEPQLNNGLNFVKIHAPQEVLRRYSEILKLRMPMREIKGLKVRPVHTNVIMEEFNSKWDKLKSLILVDKEAFPEKNHRFTAIYSRDREYLFDVDSPCFFTPAIHSRIVQFILDRKRFSIVRSDDFAFGIERLLNEEVYKAAYPLHDGDLKEKNSIRYLLYNKWASLTKFYRYQPLDYVKEYFGIKIALYFAWLGFYTHMLLPASVVGLACFAYSWYNLYRNKPSEDVCNSEIKMCPLCDHWCDYWNLNETCVHARITYLFDNPTTVFFAIFMSFWATLFLELWKRYSAEITHRWDLTGFDVQEEHPRPQYLARLSHVKRKQVNVVTNTMEPRVPFWKMKLPATILSFSVVLLLVALALATVVAVVLYRMSILAGLKVYGDRVTTSEAILFTTATAACINLVCIIIFNWIYTWVAEYLTEMEFLRTQTEFDDSLTLKIYLLQFVNYYASIFYIAFFKGKFIGSPKRYNKIFDNRQEECGPGGCLLELCIQLAIIMVGKQAMNTILEMLFPLFFKWMNTLKVKAGLQKTQSSYRGLKPQWVKDFKLVEWGPRSLFPEYLEMVLQYGFVTIFVAAFPLAPFFALLNNIFEMRLDAKKLLTFYRRPVSQRVRDIGVWYRILDSIGKLSVITNGFIIAFTSNFIPRLVYLMSVSENHTLDGYLNHTLAYFDTNDFQIASVPKNSKHNSTMCRYPDYREPPWSPDRYDRSKMFWHVLAARLAFVVVFENVVAFVMIMVKWCIPDIPGLLREEIRREAYVTNEIIIKQEAIRAQSIGIQEKQINRSLKAKLGVDCPATPEQWDRLINHSLSGSDFDLMVHHEDNGYHQTNVDGNGKSQTDPHTPTSV